MAVEEPEMTQAQMKGMAVREFFDKRFIELLESEFENTKFINLGMSEEKGEGEKRKRKIMTIAHYRPEQEKNKILIIDADTPEDLQKLISVIKKYNEGC